MGYYIEVSSSTNKAALIVSGGVMVRATGNPASPLDKFSPGTMWVRAQPYEARLIDSPPPSYAEIPEGMGLVVVVNNGLFEAAGFACDEGEFAEFTREDGRPREYVLMDRATAELASGYAAAMEARNRGR